MAATKKKKSHSPKIILTLIVLMAVGLAGYGYFSQSADLRHDEAEAAEANLEPLDPADPLFIAKPGDLVTGNANAPVTIIEYASLSCPHCAHFTNDELPAVKKQLLDNGKAKLVFRHFPLNEPALRGSQLVECQTGDARHKMLHTLFARQKDWAFEETFRDKLKAIAAENGMDAAAFDSCLNDKEGENAILAVRQEAATRARVNSTPTFFVNGVKLEEAGSAASLSKAMETPQKAAE